MDLISIIVPVYNVQQFVKKCLDSILAQTYKNIEIIIVNDGSKDNSGKICEEYKIKYPNIQVIHKTNGGLSDARNKGIEFANGKYTVFVDSDDIIAPQLVEYLYGLIQKNNADIGICEAVHCYPNQAIVFEDAKNEYIFNSEDAIEEMLYQKSFLVSAWAKIYPTEFFKDIKFPVGILFEDSAIMYRLFDKADKIAYGDAKLYGYMHRENSITTKKFSTSDCDILKICEQINVYMAERKESLKKAAKSYYTAAAFRIYINAPKNAGFDRQIEECKKFLDENCNEVLADKNIRKKMRIALLLYRHARFVMPFIYNKVNRWK